MYLSDHEVAVLQPTGLRIDHRKTGSVFPNVHVLEQVSADIELGDYEHYMLKEIFEQPQTVENAIRGRLDSEEATSVMGGLNLTAKDLRRIDRIVLTACGTSWHAGLVGEFLLEESLAKLEQEFLGRFVRIHRNCLVAKDAIRGFERASAVDADGESDGGWAVVLNQVSEKLPVSRRQQHIVREFGRIL